MAISRGVGPTYISIAGTASNSGVLNGTTVGRSLVFVLFWYDPSGTIVPTAIDISAESLDATLIAGSKFTNNASLNNVSGQIAYLANNTTGGDKTITITFSDNTYCDSAVMEYAGMDLTDQPDGSTSGSGAPDPATISTFSTTTANALVVAGGMGNGGDFTAGGFFTLFGGSGMGNSIFYAEAEDLVDAGGAGSTTIDFTGFAPNWSITAASFKPVAGGGGGKVTKNTRSWGLGMELGMGIWMPG